MAVLCVWACLFATYLVLAGGASSDEVVAGAMCAAAAALWSVGIRRASAHRFAFGVGTWAAAGRACRTLPGATLAVALVLVRLAFRRKGGEVASCFFSRGRRDDPADSGRRALGVLAASLAPDRLVLRTPPARDEVVVHLISRGEPPKDPQWPS